MVAVVTYIDADHMATYGGDFARLRLSFIEFLHLLPFYGLAVLCLDYPKNAQLLPQVPRPVLTYGIDGGADMRASDIRQHETTTQFTVTRRGRTGTLAITLNMAG